MKRVVLCILALLLCCGCAQTQEDPFRVDTVVVIPADPTAPPTETPTEAPTEAATEMPTEPPTEPEETAAPEKTTSYKSTGSGSKTSSSGKKPASTTEKPKETNPPVAEQTPALPPALTPEQPPYNPATYTLSELEHMVLLELNRCRLENELGELVINERLSGIAHLRAQEASVLWSHTRPDGRGYTSALTDYGFENELTAELMFQGPVDADAVYCVAKWMGYKASRRDICNGDFTTAGIGIYSNEGYTFVVCLLIG